MHSYIPNDIWFVIFSFLSMSERFKMKRVNRQMNDVYNLRFTQNLCNGHKLNAFQIEILDTVKSIKRDELKMFHYEVSSGKSLAAILLARYWGSPSIIVTTANLFLTMKDSIEKFTKMRYLMLRSDICKNITKTVENTNFSEYNVIVVTNRTLNHLVPYAEKFHSLIIDEFHTTHKTAAVRKMLKFPHLFKVGFSASTLRPKEERDLGVENISSELKLKQNSALHIFPIYLEVQLGDIPEALKYKYFMSTGCIHSLSPDSDPNYLEYFYERYGFDTVFLLKTLTLGGNTVVFDIGNRIIDYYVDLMLATGVVSLNTFEAKRSFMSNFNKVVPHKFTCELSNIEYDVMILSSSQNMKKRKQIIESCFNSKRPLILFAGYDKAKLGLDFSFAQCALILGSPSYKDVNQIIGRIRRINNKHSEIQIFLTKTSSHKFQTKKVTNNIARTFPDSKIAKPIKIAWGDYEMKVIQ